jgi:uncharacterized LabA/DUF88 family protein
MYGEANIAFIDGQNLHLGIKESGWKIDHKKFRTYLKDKYNVVEAYYVLGFVSEEYQELYNNLQKAGFIVLFKEHNVGLRGNKKGNVDTDIVFEIMKIMIERKDYSHFLLISGDGDYKKLVDFLIKKKVFKKLLFPNRKFASSLYLKLGAERFDYLENADVRAKIAYIEKRAP